MLYAYLNHGRWCVDCPFCNTSWLVDPATPSTLYDAQRKPQRACSCGNGALVQFPPEKDEIDQLVSGRDEVNRNWRPGESIADLRIENALHGVMV